MSEVTNNQYSHRIRKRRKRFNDNATSFGRKGIFGRGTTIDENQYKYYKNIMDALNKGFEHTELKVIMSHNVLEQMKGQEIHLASNQIVSKVMESLIGYADAGIIERFFEVFMEDVRPICSDRFASYVLQKLIEIAFLRSIRKEDLIKEDENQNGDKCDGDPNGSNPHNPIEVKKLKPADDLSDEWHNLNVAEYSDEHRLNCRNFMIRIGKYMLNNLENFMWDQCANHIIRTCILSLVGIHSPKESFKQQTTESIMKNHKRYKVPDEFLEVAKEYAERIEMWPQFNELPYQDQPSGFLGVVCFVLHVIDKELFQKFSKKIVTDAFQPIVDFYYDQANNYDNQGTNEPSDNNKDDSDDEEKENVTSEKYPQVFTSRSSVSLLEDIIILSSGDVLQSIYASLFKDYMHYLAVEPMTNFAVQKLLQRVSSKEDFENIFEKLSDQLENILTVGHSGIIHSLSAACLRLQCKQGPLFSALQKAFHIQNHKERMPSFFECLLKLKPYEYLNTETTTDTFIHLHGSLIIQDILNFHRPAFLVNCILETTPTRLVTIFKTVTGSYIVNAFMESRFVGEKSREKLLYHLSNHYTELAMSRFGSRVLEICFRAASNDILKMKIAKELVVNANQVKSTSFGRIVYKKLYLDTFRLSVEKWTNLLKKPKPNKRKAENMFENIIAS